MKEGWQIKTLDELCEIFGRIGYRGYTKNDLVSTPEEGAITLSPTNIIDGELHYDKCSYITWEKYEESPEIMVFEGDIVLVKTASIGKCALVRKLPHKATLNPQFVVLKKLKANNQYLTYFLQSPIAQKKFQEYAIGTAIPTFSQKKLGTLEVPVPPLSEQQHIVSLLDAEFAKIDTLKANAERNLQNAKDLFQAALKKELEPKEGWSAYTISNVSKSSENIKWNNVNESEKFKYIDLTSVDRSSHSIVDPQIITSQNAPSRAQRIVKTNDVIFATTRPTLRRLCIIPKEYDGDICSTGFCVIRPLLSVLPKWIYYNLSTEEFYDYVEPLQTGATYPAITDNDIRNYTIYLPSIEDQQAIVDRLDTLNEHCKTLQANYEKTIALCDDLKQALLRKAFNGEI